LISDQEEGEEILRLDSGVRIRAVWITRSLLDLEIPSEARILSSKNRYGDVRIRCKHYSGAISSSGLTPAL